MRRDCQEILPGVLLGPSQVAKDLNKLRALGVTHIICVRDEQEAFSVKPRFPENFQYLTLDVKDSDEQNLIRLFPAAKQFIDSGLALGGKVLVHCNGGITLSPAFVIMFVMQRQNMSWEEALQAVQNKRYCISCNGGFLAQLKEYESIYRANLMVSSHPAAAPRPGARRKRDDDDEHEDSNKRMIHSNDDAEDSMVL